MEKKSPNAWRKRKKDSRKTFILQPSLLSAIRFTVKAPSHCKVQTNARISPLAGQPMPMHLNTHALKSFMNGGAMQKRMGIYSEVP